MADQQLVPEELRASKLGIKLGAVEDNGVASSTRNHMIFWDVICAIALGCIIWHMIHLADTSRLQIWINAFPWLIVAFIALIQSGYALNQGGGALNTLADAFSKAKEEKKNG